MTKTIIDGVEKNYVTQVDENGDLITVQNPSRGDGDSIYSKDIDTTNSSLGNFSGAVTDLFDSLTSTIVDSTANNPKEITIALKRPVDAGNIILSTPSGDFSNVLIQLKDSAGNIVDTIDDSGTATKYNSHEYNTTPIGWCKITIQFHTADTVTLGFICIHKNPHTHTQLLAISETTGAAEYITSDDGQLNMLVRLRDATGNTKINPARSTFQNPAGSGSNGSVTLTNSATAYAIPSVAPAAGYRINLYNGSDTAIFIGYANSNSNGIELPPGDTAEDNLGASQQLYAYCASAGKVLTYSYKLTE